MKYFTRKMRTFALIILSISVISCGSGGSSDNSSQEQPSPSGSTDNGSTDTGSTDSGSTDSGSTDSGSTDSGSTDGGSTDGGSTDGGSTDGGSTDGGSTDGGSTDGGSTDGGSTDSGSTDGGSTDVGSTDGGSTDGGSTDGGSTDGGSTNNLAPTITATESIELSFAYPGTLSVNVTDPENQAINVSWAVTSSPADGDLVIYPEANFHRARLEASVLGQYTVTVTASDGTNSVSKNIEVEVTNLPPSYSGLFIYPESPRANGYVYAQLQDLIDENYYDLSVDFFWKVNDNETISGHQYFYFDGSVKKGDTISVYAEISDGTSNITTDTATVTVGNSEPNMWGLSISPESPVSADDIVAEIQEVSDQDGDVLEYTYQWFINGDEKAEHTTETLPASTTTKGDEISLSVTVSDGESSVTSSIYQIAIGDSPAVITTSGLPSQINHKELLSFTVASVDPDGDTVPEIELAYGPSGMKLNTDGTVTWTPDEIMFNQEEVFNFGFSGSDSPEAISHFSISVIDNQRKQPIARSGVEVPRQEGSLWVADYDSDGKNEILTTDSQARIFTLEQTADGYEQDWLYPFVLPSAGDIRQIISEDVNKDGSKDIIAITEYGVSIISDLEKPASLLYSHDDDDLLSATVGDFDEDGTFEIALLSGERYGSGESKLEVSELLTWTFEFSWDLTTESQSVRHGNVDNDSALEIVLDSGLIYDGLTGENQWFHTAGFGQKLAVGDIDNDGIDEIAGSVGWGPVAVFDALTKAQLWEIADTNDICSVGIGNVDNDNQEEILVGDCQWGDVVVYDGVGSSAVEQVRWDSVHHGSVNVTSGDIDNDNINEVIWGTGISSTGEDAIIIAEAINPDTVTEKELPAQLYSFTASGWSTIEPGVEKASFMVPRTGTGYNGMRLAQMDTEGTVTVSDEIASNWDRASHGLAVDYDKDGYGEVFLGTSETYNGEFQVRQLSNNQLEWGGSGGDYHNTIGAIDAFDINQDGYEDALVVDSPHVNVYDIVDQSIIWTSPSVGGVRDVTAFIPDGGGAPKIVIAGNDELSIWKEEGGSYVKESFTSSECRRVEVADLEGDNSQQIVCVSGDLYGYYANSSLEVFDLTLESIVKHDLAPTISDFTIGGPAGQPKNVLVSAYSDDWTRDKEEPPSLMLISPNTGEIVWRSSPILGPVPHRSLHYVPLDASENQTLTFSSGNAMYISR